MEIRSQQLSKCLYNILLPIDEMKETIFIFQSFQETDEHLGTKCNSTHTKTIEPHRHRIFQKGEGAYQKAGENLDFNYSQN